MKTCTKCLKLKEIREFGKLSSSKDGKNPRCKYCERVREADYRKANPHKGKIVWTRYNKKKRREQPELVKYHSIKGSAKRRGLEFNLDPEDIVFPEVCPVLGLPLIRAGKGGPKDNSPSVDRVDATKGYIKGNIEVVSHLANRIKSNATSDQVLAVAKWMKGKGL